MSEIELSINWLRREKKWREHEEPTDYIDTALEALQEKQEHEDGCEWCTNDITPNMNDFSEMFGYQPNCCPMCGKKLGENNE